MPPAPRTLRRLANVALAGQVWFVAAVILGGFLDRTYSHLEDGVSVLGARGSGAFWLQNATFVLAGAATIALSLLARHALAIPAAGTLLAIAGAGMAILAASPCSPGCPIFYGRAETVGDAVHMVVSVVVVICASLAPMVVARSLAARPDGDQRHRSLERWSRRVSAWIAFSLLLYVSISEPLELPGLGQRLVIGPGILWAGFVAWHVLRTGVSAGEGLSGRDGHSPSRIQTG